MTCYTRQLPMGDTAHAWAYWLKCMSIGLTFTLSGVTTPYTCCTTPYTISLLRKIPSKIKQRSTIFCILLIISLAMYSVVQDNTVHFRPCDLMFFVGLLLYGVVIPDTVIYLPFMTVKYGWTIYWKYIWINAKQRFVCLYLWFFETGHNSLKRTTRGMSGVFLPLVMNPLFPLNLPIASVKN